MSKLKDLFNNKQKEIEKLKVELQKEQEKQKAKVDTAQSEYDELVKQKQAWEKEVKNYSLNKSSFIRLALCLKASMTKRTVEVKNADGWYTTTVAPEPIETLIPKYRVEKLVEYLNSIDKTVFKEPVTEIELAEASKRLEKEKKKLEKL